MTSRSINFWHRLKDFCWPRYCAACDDRLNINEIAFCYQCHASLSFMSPQERCQICATSIEASKWLCFSCQEHPPRYKNVIAAYQYKGPIVTALKKLKWNGRDDIGKEIGKLFAPFLKQKITSCDVIITVPLHVRRFAQRGYNQVALFTKEAHRILVCPIPIKNNVLIRTSFAEPMKNKTKIERKAQVQDAFLILPKRKQQIQNKRILLIDDVITTGSTVETCASILMQSGAKSVEILALCRV